METAIIHFGTLGTRLGHGWDTAGTRAPKVHKRCTREARGSQEVYERGYRGVREVHDRDTRGALMGTKWKRLFFILAHLGHSWDSGDKGAQ